VIKDIVFLCLASLSCCLSGLSDELKEMKAEREKNKGNEAFRAGDFEEALIYYSRSLSLLNTVAAHNNRAQTCMHSAVIGEICNVILRLLFVFDIQHYIS